MSCNWTHELVLVIDLQLWKQLLHWLFYITADS